MWKTPNWSFLVRIKLQYFFLLHSEYFLFALFFFFAACVYLSSCYKVSPLRAWLWFCHLPVQLFECTVVCSGEGKLPFLASGPLLFGLNVPLQLHVLRLTLSPFFSSHPLHTPTSRPLVMFADPCRALIVYQVSPCMLSDVWDETGSRGIRETRSEVSQMTELGLEAGLSV